MLSNSHFPCPFFNFPNSLIPNAIPIPSAEKHIQEAKRTTSYADLKTRRQIKEQTYNEGAREIMKDGREIS
jgi:hypothetical protein